MVTTMDRTQLLTTEVALVKATDLGKTIVAGYLIRISVRRLDQSATMIIGALFVQDGTMVSTTAGKD